MWTTIGMASWYQRQWFDGSLSAVSAKEELVLIAIQSRPTCKYIAVTKGTRTFLAAGWYCGKKTASNYEPSGHLLASPSQLPDTSWIKQGKVAWDWWNANNIDSVDFKSGITCRTYKYYIDFARSTASSTSSSMKAGTSLAISSR